MIIIFISVESANYFLNAFFKAKGKMPDIIIEQFIIYI